MSEESLQDRYKRYALEARDRCDEWMRLASLAHDPLVKKACEERGKASEKAHRHWLEAEIRSRNE